LKKVEIESFIKSFLLFFVSQSILLSALFFIEFKKEIQTLDQTIFTQMRICSFDLSCDNYKIDFAPLEEDKLYKLEKNDIELSALFPINGSEKNALKIYLTNSSYYKMIQTIKSKLLWQYFVVLGIVFILSVLFSFYTLSPLKNALKLTEEFIKDILHDFNTPLSTLRLNISMLKDELGENKKILRAEKSIENILNLQMNLRSYLNNHTTQKEKFFLDEFIESTASRFYKNAKGVEFKIDIQKYEICTNKDAFSRIVDNIISNSIKYNKENGYVYIHIKNNILEIRDTGDGIKNPNKVFKRFYKEHSRGIGIGLHIVKKLCDELNIKISVRSEYLKGTSFFLDLNKIRECK
jgi:signal transduction histidine kinase